MRNHPLAFIDIEATGLDPEKNEIIEIGLVIAEQGLSADKKITLKKIEEWEIKIKPTHMETADPEALIVAHYNEADWASAVDISSALKILSEKTVDATMVGHNVAFDSSFLENSFSRTGIVNRMHYHKLDTLSIAFTKLYGHESVEKLSLRSLCEYLGVENKDAHTALSDARATFEVFEKLMAL